MTNVLAGQIELDDVIQPWGAGGLSLLASGSTPPNPSELLGSARMAELMDQLQDASTRSSSTRRRYCR